MLRRPSPTSIVVWSAFGLAAAGLGLGIGVGRWAIGVVLDIVSLWPLAILPLVLWVALTPARHRGKRWLGAIPPLIWIGWLGLGVWLHETGFPPLPSTSAELIGPKVEQTSARLTIDLPGTLQIGRHRLSELYRVSFIRRRGGVGAPQAVELPVDQRIDVAISERAPSPWFLYEGWYVDLAARHEWTVIVSGRPLEADLSGIDLRELVACCSGQVVLPATTRGTPISLTGSLTLVVPQGTPVEIFGQAFTPAGWTKTEDGWQSPDAGVGYRISVVTGKTVTIEYP